MLNVSKQHQSATQHHMLSIDRFCTTKHLHRQDRGRAAMTQLAMLPLASYRDQCYHDSLRHEPASRVT